MKLEKEITNRLPLVSSSANADQVSLTLKGASVLLLLYVLRQAGITVSESEILTLITLLTGIISSLATLYGLVRKIYYRGK